MPKEITTIDALIQANREEIERLVKTLTEAINTQTPNLDPVLLKMTIQLQQSNQIVLNRAKQLVENPKP